MRDIDIIKEAYGKLVSQYCSDKADGVEPTETLVETIKAIEKVFGRESEDERNE